MSQFSKGEWYADEWDIGSGGVFYEDCGDISVWDNEANARLIAEAPVYDLLNKAFHLLVLGKNAANDAICREIDECLSRIDDPFRVRKEGNKSISDIPPDIDIHALGDVCPMCGQHTLIHESGCVKCQSCMWSACG